MESAHVAHVRHILSCRETGTGRHPRLHLGRKVVPQILGDNPQLSAPLGVPHPSRLPLPRRSTSQGRWLMAGCPRPHPGWAADLTAAASPPIFSLSRTCFLPQVLIPGATGCRASFWLRVCFPKNPVCNRKWDGWERERFLKQISQYHTWNTQIQRLSI